MRSLSGEVHNARLVRIALGAVLCVGIAQAQSGGQPWLPQNQVVWSTFQNGTISRIQQSTVQTLASENDFQTYWVAATGQPAQNTPKNVDWLKEKLVAIHIGSRPSSGYTVAVTGIDRGTGTAVVHAVEQTPVRGQYVSKIVTSPWVIVRVPRDLGNIQLDLQQKAGISTGGVTIYPGRGAVVHPDNYGRVGGGSVDPRNTVSWSTLTSGDRSYASQSGLWVCGSYDEWCRIWSQLTGSNPSAAPASIDWNREKVVVLGLGTRPSGGFAIKVLAVEKNGANGIIRAVEETPVAGSRSSRRATQPFTVIRVPRDLANFSVDLTQREGNGDTRVIGRGGRG